MNARVAACRMIVLALAFAVGACGAGEKDSNGRFGLDMNFNDTTKAEDAGLPTYPGSRPYKDAERSSSAANIGLSTPFFGVKVVAMNMETSDSSEKVAAFYRQALSKYGAVLECKDDAHEQQSIAHDEVVCDPKDLATHSVVYKVGTKRNQRIVAIKPVENGTQFSLAHLDMREPQK